LNLAYPQLDMSGNLVLDAASPQLNVEMEGRKVNVDAIREVALALAGDDPDLREVFDIIRGGKVPLITFRTQGSSLDDLSEWDNMFIKGSLLDGKIS
ncbi:MAG: hypothetical protein GWN86_08490, partial [Desulfobacterales bacterium]|nr:hypothetical protein [Desulfobacterales bacterium]